MLCLACVHKKLLHFLTAGVKRQLWCQVPLNYQDLYPVCIDVIETVESGRQTDRQIDRLTDRQADRQTDRQIGRQTDRLIDRK